MSESEVASPSVAESIVSTPTTEDVVAPVVPDGESEVVVETPSKEESDFATRFAALSRKEKFLRDQEASNKESSDKYKRYSDLKERAVANPLEVLKEFGIDLDSVITASLGEDAPPMSVEDQLAELKAQITADKDSVVKQKEDDKTAEEKAYQDSIDEAVLNHKAQITDFMSQNTEKYELINLQGAEELIWEVTEAHYDANQEVLTPEQASDKVEQYLEGQVKKAMELSRFKVKQDPSTVEEPGFKIETVDPIKPSSPTLTTDQTTTPPDKSTSSHLTDEESRANAAKLLNWT